MIFSESLKKNKDFQEVYKTGKSFANRYLVMYVKENESQKNRLGISVSKKVGNSIVRHRLARLIRESYRLNEADFSSGKDIIVVARVNAKDRGFHDIESALLHLGKLHKIINRKEMISDEKNIDLND
ncbi:MAG: ribonuclease P protein component [Eubacteriales bacterium]|nr:ribonuclease P protein component [Eubacteriales bacterium]